MPPYLLSDPEGEPLFGADGQRLTKIKLIATQELIICDTPDKLSTFWSTMTSASAALRQARAAKNKREASSAATTSSAPQSPTASAADHDPPNLGPHRLSAGVPADDFVLPPIYAHDTLLTGATKVKINPADEAILEDMGPEALRSEIATHSMALLKLVENPRPPARVIGRSARLKEAEDRLKTVSEERDGAVQKVEEQKVMIGELEGKLSRLQVTGVVEEGEKELDPQGV
ncbi:hypothetical protein L195_g051762, partial [Trifolium pratense]